MSTLFVVLQLLVGQGRHQHWQIAYVRSEAETQTMLCERRAAHLRAAATPGAHQRLAVWCRKKPDAI